MSEFWHKYNAVSKPKNDGRYFAVREYRGTRFPAALYFSNNLEEATDIPKSEIKKRYGFYYCDDEWGDVFVDNVILWAEIPNFTEGELK